MTTTALFESTAGLLLLFFLPGYTTTRAVFPEWRIRGADPWRRGVEVVTLSFVLSIVWTVVVGYVLLAFVPGGFQAPWTNPELQRDSPIPHGRRVHRRVACGGVRTGSAAGVSPPGRPRGEGAWELSRELDRLAREERRIEHAIRVGGGSGPTAVDLEQQLSSLREESSRLRQEREREYAQ